MQKLITMYEATWYKYKAFVLNIINIFNYKLLKL
jgi:hypothetical protein